MNHKSRDLRETRALDQLGQTLTRGDTVVYGIHGGIAVGPIYLIDGAFVYVDDDGRTVYRYASEVIKLTTPNSTQGDTAHGI
jgi:hypothetical protein